MKPAIQDRTPRAHSDEIEATHVGRLMGTWALRTNDTFEEVTAPGFFNSVAGHGLRVNDRIDVVCECLSKTPTHAGLVITLVQNIGSEERKGVKVQVLTGPVTVEPEVEAEPAAAKAKKAA